MFLIYAKRSRIVLSCKDISPYTFDFIFSWEAWPLILYFLWLQQRRERIAERLRALQELVPNTNKVNIEISDSLIFDAHFVTIKV